MGHQEPHDIRLTRIEDGIVAIHSKIDAKYEQTETLLNAKYDQVMQLLTPVVNESQDTRDFKVAHKTNLRWILWIAMAALSLSCAAIKGCTLASVITPTAAETVRR